MKDIDINPTLVLGHKILNVSEVTCDIIDVIVIEDFLMLKLVDMYVHQIIISIIILC